jgi:hypothetical protein
MGKAPNQGMGDELGPTDQVSGDQLQHFHLSKTT